MGNCQPASLYRRGSGMRFRERKRLAYGHPAWGSEARLVRRQSPARDVRRPYPGICCAPPRWQPCPCQAARANGCSIKILIAESGPRKSWHRAAKCSSGWTKVHVQLLPACLGGELLPGHGVLAKGGPRAAPRSPVSPAGPRLPGL